MIYGSVAYSTEVVILVSLFFFFPPSAAVVAITKLPVTKSNAEVAEAALRAVSNLALGPAENTAKLGSAGGCEGG